MTNNAPVELAVFDFDGTSISGNSPVILVRYLLSHRMLQKRVFSRIAAWAVAYKLRLPQNEAWVRGQVFSAFEGMPKPEVDAFLHAFYYEKISNRVRPKLDKAIALHHAEGREVVVVSATFEPIILAAMEEHDYDYQFSTRMKTDVNGCYLCQVDGLPVEGDEKLRLVVEYANKKYGQGNWVLAYAYGDHHSDRTLLEAAQVPVAVTPDRPLARTAHEKGWTILDWSRSDSE